MFTLVSLVLLAGGLAGFWRVVRDYRSGVARFYLNLMGDASRGVVRAERPLLFWYAIILSALAALLATSAGAALAFVALTGSH